MDASTLDETVQRFLTLCATTDSRLRSAIVECRFSGYSDGWIAFLRTADHQAHWLWNFMPVVVALLTRLGHFKELDVHTDKFSINFQLDDLMATFPPDKDAPESGIDRVSTLEKQLQQDDPTRTVLLTYLSRTHHTFVITLEGIYHDVRLHQGSRGTVPASEMMGQPIAPFIGEAGAACLLAAMRQAYAAAQPCTLEYNVIHPNGEPRRYQAEILPIVGTQTCVVLSRRIPVKQASALHSPAFPA